MDKIYFLFTFAILLGASFADEGEEGSGMSISSEELDPADVEEPGCPKITHLKTLNYKTLTGEWHLPYMSNHWIRYMAKRMHGKFMKKSSMARACVKMELREMPEDDKIRNDNATIWIHSRCPGTGAELNLACTPSPANNAKIYCRSKDSDDHEGDSWVYVVDSDNENWALVVRCFPNNGMNWAIFSKVKELDKTLVKSLMKEVEEMGFQVFSVVEIPYEKCAHKA